jgi:hypothetical protein|tara:strand:+ start:588 stop:1067 length:480 start_codon:yes stop_codon:yes gene_type:complete
MNEPALNIPIKPSGELEISYIPSEQLTMIWDKVEKYLKKTASRSNGRTRVEDIFHDLLNNNSQLWIVFDTGNLDITGVMITLFNDYPTGKKMLCIDHITGKNMQAWAEEGIDILTNFAKTNNCDGLEGVGRHGLWHWVKNKVGWKKPATFYEYNFEEDE